MPNKDKSDTAPRRSGIHAPVALVRSVQSISQKALGKVGQSFAAVVSHWPQIVGGEMANKCLPIALNFPRGKNSDAVLHLATHSAFALELSHQSPMMMERINAFLGFRAVSEIRLDHKLLALPESPVVTGAFRGGAGQSHTAKPSLVSQDVSIPDEVCSIYTEIKDPELRAKLESLCRAVVAA